MLKYGVIMEKQVIYGNIPSKSNSYKIVTINDHLHWQKQKAVKDLKNHFISNATSTEKPIYRVTLSCTQMCFFRANEMIWMVC